MSTHYKLIFVIEKNAMLELVDGETHSNWMSMNIEFQIINYLAIYNNYWSEMN